MEKLIVCIGCGKIKHFKGWFKLTSAEAIEVRKGKVNVDLGQCFDCKTGGDP